MKTLHLAIIVIFTICSTVGSGTAYAYGSDGGYLTTLPPPYPNTMNMTMHANLTSPALQAPLPYLLQILSPLKQFKSGITVTDVKCSADYVLTIKSEDGSPVCVKPSTVRILTERGWAKFESAQSNHASNAKTNPFGIAGLIIYYGGGPCGVGACPLNTFNLKITSNYTAYLLGYNICDGNICAKNDNMTTLLPISNVSFPNFKTIALPEDLNWKYKDTIHIQVMASAFPENETAVSIDLGNSTTFP